MKPKELRKHFIESLYATLDGVVSPTPYLEIKEGDAVDVKFLDGKGRLPTAGTTEVTVQDIDAAALFFDDFNVLWEGVTGVGKSHTADAMGYAVCGLEGYLNLTLSSGVLGTSAMDPFTKTVLEHGMPKTVINKDACSKYGILFLDEINAGDFKDTSRVLEGKAQVNGHIEYLRMPIPGTNRYKRIAVIAAMNPPDALHSHATELSIAGENRFLKFRFPNGVAEAASTQMEKHQAEDLHDQFWREFKKKTGQKGTWREIYPAVTDTSLVAAVLDGETREFIDASLGYVGENPLDTYARNVELMKSSKVEPRFTLKKDNDLDKILAAQGILKHKFVRRDLGKIKNFGRLLGFIKSIKDGSYEPTVSLNDVAASIGIVLESKTVTGSDYGRLMTLVNDARAAYGKLVEEVGVPKGYGIRSAIWQAAVNAGVSHGFDGYSGTLARSIEAMNKQASGGKAQTTLRSRLLADLVVLDHFSKTHEAEIISALKEKDKAFDAVTQVYDANKGKASVYEHRLGSIFR